MGIPEDLILALMEIAKTIGSIIQKKLNADPILENKQTFQKNGISYHDRVRKLLYKDEGSPERLAEDIAKDKLFCYYATDEISKQIIYALMYVDKLPRRRKGEARKILQQLLRVFEHARV